jgi:hypothetical protein
LGDKLSSIPRWVPFILSQDIINGRYCALTPQQPHAIYDKHEQGSYCNI